MLIKFCYYIKYYYIFIKKKLNSLKKRDIVLNGINKNDQNIVFFMKKNINDYENVTNS